MIKYSLAAVLLLCRNKQPLHSGNVVICSSFRQCCRRYAMSYQRINTKHWRNRKRISSLNITNSHKTRKVFFGSLLIATARIITTAVMKAAPKSSFAVNSFTPPHSKSSTICLSFWICSAESFFCLTGLQTVCQLNRHKSCQPILLFPLPVLLLWE